MPSSFRPVALTTMLLLGVVTGMAVIPFSALATTSATITASPNDAGLTATHTATATVGSCEAGDSLNKFRVNYSVGAHPADISNVGQNDIKRVGIDTDGDGTIDKDVSNDLSSVSASNNGHTLNIGFGGSYSLYDGDVVIVEYADVQNPNTTGTFDVNVSVNYQSNPVCPSTTTLTIDHVDSNATVTASPATEGVNATHAVNRTVGTTNDGTALTSFTVDYTAANATGLTANDVSRAGIDTDGDGAVETTLQNNLTGVTVSNSGHTVTFDFDGSKTLQSGDRLVLAYGDVANPQGAGTTTVSTVFNGTTANASLTVAANTTTSAATIGASPDSPGDVATHTVTATAATNDTADPLRALTVDYRVGSNPADATGLSVRQVGIDTDGDGTIETNVSDDLQGVAVTNGGATLTLDFGGAYTLERGDVLRVTYENVTNPDSAGEYAVGVDLNPNSGLAATTTLSIVGNLSAGQASLTADPATPGDTANHTASIVAGSNDDGDSLNKLRVDYSVGAHPADVSNVSQSDIRRVGIDTDGDGTIDTNVSDDLSSVSASNDGHTLDIGFGGSYTLQKGDVVIVEYADATNPNTTGTFDVNVSVNYQSDPVTTGTATLDISAAQSETSGETSTEPAPANLSVTAASIRAEPAMATAADATHVLRTTVSTGGPTVSLQSVTINYAVGADPADVGDFARADVVSLGVDTDGDGTMDRSLTDVLATVRTDRGGELVGFTFDGPAELDDGETLVVAYADVQNPGNAGEYRVDVRLNGSETSASASPTLSITPDDDGGTNESTASTTRDTVVVPVGSQSTAAIVHSTAPGDTVTVDVRSNASKRNVTLDRLRLQFNRSGNLSMRVSRGGATPREIGGSIGFFTVDHGPANLSAAVFEFTVTKRNLTQRGVPPEDVHLYRYHDGRWHRLETTVVGETAEAYRFEAVSPGLSTFAVSTQPRATATSTFEVRNASVLTETDGPGYRVRIETTVANTGEIRDTITIPLTLNGVVVDRQEVTLAPGESAALTFTKRVSPDRSYTVGVGGVTVATVNFATVSESKQISTPTPTAGPRQALEAVPIPLSQAALMALLAVALPIAWGVGRW